MLTYRVLTIIQVVLNKVIGYNVLDFTSEMDYKDTRLDKGRKHKGLGQVNDTNIQDIRL